MEIEWSKVRSGSILSMLVVVSSGVEICERNDVNVKVKPPLNQWGGGGEVLSTYYIYTVNIVSVLVFPIQPQL